MLLVALPQPALALNNGLGRTPPMGYNAYDHVGCCATEETMRAQADALVRTGLSKLGYEYVNADCGWIGGRHANGTLYESSAKFPSGMPALARYLHAQGLKSQTRSVQKTTLKTCLKRAISDNFKTKRPRPKMLSY